MTRAEQVAAILALLEQHPKGLRRKQIQEILSLPEWSVVKALTELRYLERAGVVKLGKGNTLWADSANLPALLAKQPTPTRIHRAAKKVVYVEPKEGGPREWVRSEWKPPGPLIPSVWDLPRVMGLA